MREMRERDRGWCAVEEMRSRFARVIDDTLSGQMRRNFTFADPDAQHDECTSTYGCHLRVPEVPTRPEGLWALQPGPLPMKRSTLGPHLFGGKSHVQNFVTIRHTKSNTVRH